MLNDRDFDELTYPIIELYSKLERELLIEVAQRFADYGEIKGVLEWYLKKLDELGGLDRNAVKLIAETAKLSDKQVLKMLEEAGYRSIDFRTYDRAARLGLTSGAVNKTVIANVVANSHKALRDTFRLIHTKALESAKQSYMDSLNQVYLEVSTGLYDYESAIKRAIGRLSDKGITAATYRRKDGTLVRYSLEGTVRRDVLTAVNQLANETNDKVAEDLGADYVYVTEHLGARNKGTGHQNHESWQGQLYKRIGSEPNYPNFQQTTGYGLIDGLAGVNCRHLHYAFFPGVSEIPKRLVDDAENTRVYELMQKQRMMERSIRHLQKKQALQSASGDIEGSKKTAFKLKLARSQLNFFVKANPSIRRLANREIIYTV
ncbi:MAG: hypothetical protein CVU86_07010 [Firmicutes bacterium HGW-Firmicutes-11]|jgi:hypothetical protein|nr:MAG: hypothetical protein CVU94_00795 [Firmicutes bacterium HGW-Firmicutes-19]PKM84474.1 MAG: hypothetical protein CVU86_07010 [Firmicutes bacterium HGW-Firmicutes-11]